MSKDYLTFANETGTTAFLAGVVDVLSDNLQMILDFSYSLDVDIFYVEGNDLSLLNDSLKKRLLCYKQYYGGNTSEDKINALDFPSNIVTPLPSKLKDLFISRLLLELAI